MTPLERLLAALEAHDCDPKPIGASHVAKCPAHDDQHPSLNIGVGDDGRVLFKCHAGCEQEAVVAALDLTMRDLFPPIESGTRSRPKINATYDYVDDRGALLFQVVRFLPKNFKQRRPDGMAIGSGISRT